MLFLDSRKNLSGMKILLEIAIIVGLNLFFFGYLQRELLFLVVAQRNQIIVFKRSVKSPKVKERDRQLWMLIMRDKSIWPRLNFGVALVVRSKY